MKIEFYIWTSLVGSPGFSRIKRSRQYATAPAGAHRLKPGFLDMPYPDYGFKLHQ